VHIIYVYFKLKVSFRDFFYEVTDTILSINYFYVEHVIHIYAIAIFC